MTATTTASASEQLRKVTLAPPRRFATGTILTLRMRGHSRSPNQAEYFAPAVVIDQFMPNGEISALIWDASAGTHYAASYAIRELGTRGEGNEREMYVLQDNVGEVLFAPDEFASMYETQEQLLRMQHNVNRTLADLSRRVDALESAATAPAATQDEHSKQAKPVSKATS